MPIDITQQIAVFEAGETQQFTYVSCVNIPATVAFNLRNFRGDLIALTDIQSGETVGQSLTIMNSATGRFFINRILPDTPGIYFPQFVAWDAASRPYPTTWEIEIKETGAHSFFTYGDVEDVIKNARQIFNRSNMTVRDIKAYMEAADAWVDLKLQRVAINSLPITPTPNFLRTMSKAGALYFYYSERYGIEREEAPPGIVDQWDELNKLLDGVVAGSYSIAGIDIAVSRAGQIYISTQNDKPIFGMKDWILQEVDQNMLDREDAL